MKPKKLIRDKIIRHLKSDEYEILTDKEEVNRLCLLKIREEVQDIVNSDFKDIMEFADLLEIVFSFAVNNGISKTALLNAALDKCIRKGKFTNIVLTNMNPNNPSNKLYFEE